MALDGAASKQGAAFSVRTTGLPRRRHGHAVGRSAVAAPGRTTAARWESVPVPGQMKQQVNGLSGSMGADAFQELARHVRDVRVAEHQQIGGKLVTTIAGEIDTAGMLEAVTKLGSLSGTGGEKPALSFDLDDLGLKIGDIKAVLSIDERTHLLDSRPDHARHRGAGQEAGVQAALPADEREPAGRPAVRSRLDRPGTTFGAWTPTVSGGCASRPSSSRRDRSSSPCGTSRARTSRPGPSPCSRSSAWPGSRSRSGRAPRARSTTTSSTTRSSSRSGR